MSIRAHGLCFSQGNGSHNLVMRSLGRNCMTPAFLQNALVLSKINCVMELASSDNTRLISFHKAKDSITSLDK